MDLDAIKAKLAKMQDKNNNGKSKEEREARKKLQWKPPLGESTIRVVPSKFDKANPFKELGFYYGIAKYPMQSPRNYGEKDPIYEFAQQLRQGNDQENWNLAKKLYPKTRVFLPVIVRGEEEKGVRLWQFGKLVHEAFLQLAVAKGVGDYTDILEGRDINLTTFPDQVGSTKYNKTTILPDMEKTPLSQDSALVEKWLNEQPNPVDLYDRTKPEDMKENLKNWLTPEDDGPVDDEKIEDEENDDPPTADFSSLDKEDSNKYTLDINKVKKAKVDEFTEMFNEGDDSPF